MHSIRASIRLVLVPFAVALLALAGCAGKCEKTTCPRATPAPAHPLAGQMSAVAVIHPTAGNTAKGVVRFTQSADGVKIVANIEGLSPNGKHGFHIHQFGDCTGPKGKTAGGHYNPEGHEHAGPPKPMRHAGDLGNLTANAEGKAHLELTVKNVSIGGAKNPIVGRGLIVHKKMDDMKSQPTGAAGPRIGCGVIGLPK